MQNRFMLGVSVGEAFAEYCLLEGAETVATKRAYLSRENLKSSLQNFVSEHLDKNISNAAVTLRVPEKLLDYKLNGAIAHVTTEGLENWLGLHKSSQASLTTANIQFALSERIHADGSISKPLTTDELENIANKLQSVSAKKVCLHLLHASVNPIHEEQARQYLMEKGFEVFVPEKSDNTDEVSRWKKNALNATVASLFLDLKTNIEEALQAILPAEKIFYLNAQGVFSQDIDKKPISGLAAAYTAMALSRKNTSADILYLGLENFALISPKKWKWHWQSPWGKVENKHLSFNELSVQPTQSIELNAFQNFDFSKHSEGWEPGPMSLGRGQKATLIDLWTEHPKLAKVDGLQDRLTPTGLQRFKNSMMVLTKASRLHNRELSTTIKELQSLAMQKLTMESLLFRDSKELIVTGPLAEIFANGFKKDTKAQLQIDEFAMSRSVALLGQSQLKG